MNAQPRWRSCATSRRVVGILIVALVLAVPMTAGADIFQFSDKDGVVHYTNKQPTDGTPWRRLYRSDDDDVRPAEVATSPSIQAPRPSKTEAARDSRQCVTTQVKCRLAQFVREAAVLYQLPESFIWAVMRTASGFEVERVSDDGRMGLMQLSSEDALEMGVVDAFEPRQSVLGGARYLRMLANQYNGDLVLTVAGFHAGEKAVADSNGVPPNKLTRQFVKEVLHHYYAFRNCGSSWLGVCAHLGTARRRLAPTDIFAQVAPSVFQVVTKTATGSAVAVTSKELLTNAHVVEDATTVEVVQGQTVLQAHVVESDLDRDRAILRVGPTAQLKPVPGARAFRDLRIGERVFTLGYPLAGITFADGLISGVRRMKTSDGHLALIQTSAPISPGSSGGGLFDSAGNLIGITTLTLRDSQNLNCAISTDHLILDDAKGP